MNFKKWVKSIQTAGYNGARTVYKYFKAENLNNFPSKSVNNLFKFSAQNSDLEYLFWRSKNPPLSSDLKLPLVIKKTQLP